MIEIVILNILRIAIISSIGICLILILKKILFKEYTQNFNYYIWLIVVVRMILKQYNKYCQICMSVIN